MEQQNKTLAQIFVAFERGLPVNCDICKKPITRRKEAVIEEDKLNNSARAVHTKCYFKS